MQHKLELMRIHQIYCKKKKPFNHFVPNCCKKLGALSTLPPLVSTEIYRLRPDWFLDITDLLCVHLSETPFVWCATDFRTLVEIRYEALTPVIRNFLNQNGVKA